MIILLREHVKTRLEAGLYGTILTATLFQKVGARTVLR